jgi:hypothetical protein
VADLPSDLLGDEAWSSRTWQILNDVGRLVRRQKTKRLSVADEILENAIATRSDDGKRPRPALTAGRVDQSIPSPGLDELQSSIGETFFHAGECFVAHYNGLSVYRLDQSDLTHGNPFVQVVGGRRGTIMQSSNYVYG